MAFVPFAQFRARHFRVEITLVAKRVFPMRAHDIQSPNTRSREAFELAAGGVLMRGVVLSVDLPGQCLGGTDVGNIVDAKANP